MDSIDISPRVNAKLKQKHNVTRAEVTQCFQNRSGISLIDDRENHRRDPPTLWFVAQTNVGRLLKIVFQMRDGKIHLITAYEPNEAEMRIYKTKAE